MLIEAGKFYRTKDGKKREVLKTDHNSGSPVLVWDNETRTTYNVKNTGTVYASGVSPYDLVAEWKDPFEPKVMYVTDHFVESAGKGPNTETWYVKNVKDATYHNRVLITQVID